MVNNPIEPLIKILAFKGVQNDALSSFEQVLQDGFNAAQEGEFPLSSYFLKRPDIVDRKGLIDAWLVAICMTTFAQGIAVGRGATEIAEQDVLAARNGLCDEYPKCQLMRLQDYVRALDAMIEQSSQS